MWPSKAAMMASYWAHKSRQASEDRCERDSACSKAATRWRRAVNSLMRSALSRSSFRIGFLAQSSLIQVAPLFIIYCNYNTATRYYAMGDLVACPSDTLLTRGLITPPPLVGGGWGGGGSLSNAQGALYHQTPNP